MAQENYKPSLKFYYDSNNYINYERLGSGAQTLVFIHGFGASLSSWNDIKNLFDLQKYTLYFVDLKGFGFSSKPHTNEYHITDQAKIVLGLLNQLSLNHVVLIGHSYGGSVALTALVDLIKKNNESLISRIILIDAPATPNVIPFFIDVLRNPITNFISLHIMPAEYRSKFILHSLFFDRHKVDSIKIERYAYFFKEKSFDYAITKMAEQIIPDNFSAYINAYSSIKIPCLIIWGNNDPILPVSMAFNLQKSIKGASLKIIENCGHITQEECPEKTYQLISDFLNDD